MRAPSMINHRGLISHFTAIKKKTLSPFHYAPSIFPLLWPFLFFPTFESY